MGEVICWEGRGNWAFRLRRDRLCGSEIRGDFWGYVFVRRVINHYVRYGYVAGTTVLETAKHACDTRTAIGTPGSRSLDAHKPLARSTLLGQALLLRSDASRRVRDKAERSQGLSLIVPALITQNFGVSKIDQHADQRGEGTAHIPPRRCLAIMKSLETPSARAAGAFAIHGKVLERGRMCLQT
jgi:hypothetical protein